LREALAARPDDDFTISAPVRRRSPVKRKPKAPSLGVRLLGLALQHPRRIAVTLVLAGCGGAIAWNALVLQTAHHPAPLFNGTAAPAAIAQPMPPARPAAPVSEAPSPFVAQPLALAPTPPAAAPKLPSRSAIAELIRNGEPGAIAQPSPRAASAPAAVPAAPAPAPVTARAPTARDPIAEMIRMGGPVPVPPANVGREASDTVLAGQRALAKLGYGIKADGIMGSGTRQAIERFEHDRKLPVTGEFNARTLRELTAASGGAVP
jgi:hypothetical protein